MTTKAPKDRQYKARHKQAQPEPLVQPAKDGPITDADLADSLEEHNARWKAHQERLAAAKRKAAYDGLSRAQKKALKVARRRATKKAIRHGHCLITR